MNRLPRQKINDETVALNDTLGQMDLIDTFRAFHLKAREYTLFSSAHETFSRIGHILKHNTNLNKFEVEIILSIFADLDAMKPEINHKKKLKRTHKDMEAK